MTYFSEMRLLPRFTLLYMPKYIFNIAINVCILKNSKGLAAFQLFIVSTSIVLFFILSFLILDITTIPLKPISGENTYPPLGLLSKITITTLANFELSKVCNICYDAKSPLDQFEIRNLISLDVPILGYLRIFVSNIAFYLIIATVIALAFNLLGTNKDKIVANHWSISQESIYATINSIVLNQINSKKGQIYFPFIYTLFLFILINNLVGMVPYSFASTSHFILTFFISFTVVLGATILGFQKHGLKLFSLFVPAGCPLGLLPLLVIIEFISYLARNVSLGLRLAANILSGHMLLNILSGFAYNIMTSGFVYFFVGLIPLAFIIAFSGLELGIAFIQAQVFVVLTSSYIKDALDLH